MANTAAQTLFTEANCYACLDGATPFTILLTGALLVNLEAQGIDMTPQEWMDEAACYACLPGVSQAQAIIIAMLAAGGGGGGGGGSGLTCGNYGGGPPTFTPSSGCAKAIDTSDGTEWTYYSGSWH